MSSAGVNELEHKSADKLINGVSQNSMGYGRTIRVDNATRVQQQDGVRAVCDQGAKALLTGGQRLLGLPPRFGVAKLSRNGRAKRAQLPFTMKSRAASAARMAAGVSTRSKAGRYPSRSNWRTRRSASDSESFTINTRRAVRIHIPLLD
jgi:hypothetical protein